MDTNSKRSDRANSGNSFVVPLIAAAAIAIALVFGWGMMNSNSNDQAANPANQSSETGLSSGESGKSTVQNDPDMKANPGAGAAPTKAPGTNPGAADTQPQPQQQP
jgi:hypothetical protein